MNEGTKTATLLFLGVVTLWDAFTTVSGTLHILGSTGFAMVLSLLCAIFVAGILINTVPIINNPSDDILTFGAKGLWVVCLIYDFYTAYTGNYAFTNTGVENKEGVYVLLLMTTITVACPVAISYILFRRS